MGGVLRREVGILSIEFDYGEVLFDVPAFLFNDLVMSDCDSVIKVLSYVLSCVEVPVSFNLYFAFVSPKCQVGK